MRTRLSIFRTVFLGIYLFLFVVFSFSIAGLVLLETRKDLTDIPFYYTDARADIKNGLSTFSSGSGTVGRKPVFEIDFSNRNKWFWIFATGCGVTFIVAFVAGPMYTYVTYRKPARRLIRMIREFRETGANNEEIDPQALSGLCGIVASVLKTHSKATSYLKRVAQGDLKASLDGMEKDDVLAESLMSLNSKLKDIWESEGHSSWTSQNYAALERLLKIESDFEVLSGKAIQLLTKSVGGGVGLLYEYESEGEPGFIQLNSYGVFNEKKDRRRIPLGEGQVGEIAMHCKTVVLENLPKNYLVIHSGLGSSHATDVVIVPLMFRNSLYGAIEIGTFIPLQKHEIHWLEMAAESLAAHFFNYKVNKTTRARLEELAKEQADELVRIGNLQRETYRKLEMKLREVEEEKARSKGILEGCVDGVVSFDASGIISFWNKAAEEISGYRAADSIGRNITEYLPVLIQEQNGTAKVLCITGATSKEISVRTEMVFAGSNGDCHDVLVTSTQTVIDSGVVFTLFIQKISVDLF
jgi:PAS domain S-box-containing protein